MSVTDVRHFLPPCGDGVLTSLVPNHQLLMWSTIALAADMAEDRPRFSITVAPRFWTV